MHNHAEIGTLHRCPGVVSPGVGRQPCAVQAPDRARHGSGRHSLLAISGACDSRNLLPIPLNPESSQVAARARGAAALSAEEHQMVPCALYRGVPCSGGRDSQPFRVGCAPTAALLMDLHAHLSRAEVIGILGGTWDAEARHMRCAHPCGF